MQIIDSYSESNYQTSLALNSATRIKRGQSFTGDGRKLDSCKFYSRKTGSPTGNAVAKIYAHTGTFGINGEPTGEALATSDNFDVSTFPTSLALITFDFTGAEKIILANGTHYCVIIEYSGGDWSNYIVVGFDTTSPTHGGNSIEYITSWNANSSNDCCFYIYGYEIKIISETFKIAETITKKTTRAISETFVVADTIIKKAIKTISETFKIAEVFNKLKLLLKSISETFKISDSISKKTTKIFTETIVLSETIFRKIGKTFLEIFTITEIFDKIRARIKTLTETFAIKETIKRRLNGVIISLWDRTNKNVGGWSRKVKDILTRCFLLKESADFILLETGDKIIIEPDASAAWTVKAKDVAGWSITSKDT